MTTVQVGQIGVEGLAGDGAPVLFYAPGLLAVVTRAGSRYRIVGAAAPGLGAYIALDDPRVGELTRELHVHPGTAPSHFAMLWSATVYQYSPRTSLPKVARCLAETVRIPGSVVVMIGSETLTKMAVDMYRRNTVGISLRVRQLVEAGFLTPNDVPAGDGCEVYTLTVPQTGDEIPASDRST